LHRSYRCLSLAGMYFCYEPLFTFWLLVAQARCPRFRLNRLHTVLLSSLLREGAPPLFYYKIVFTSLFNLLAHVINSRIPHLTQFSGALAEHWTAHTRWVTATCSRVIIVTFFSPHFKAKCGIKPEVEPDGIPFMLSPLHFNYVWRQTDPECHMFTLHRSHGYIPARNWTLCWATLYQIQTLWNVVSRLAVYNGRGGFCTKRWRQGYPAFVPLFRGPCRRLEIACTL